MGQLTRRASIFDGFGVLLERAEQSLGLKRAQSFLALSPALLAEGVIAWPAGRWIERGR